MKPAAVPPVGAARFIVGDHVAADHGRFGTAITVRNINTPAIPPFVCTGVSYVLGDRVVVYDWDDCSNPNTAITIVGYSKISITNVQNAPEKRIEGKILCDYFSNEATRGGGGNFGLKGTIPGLVE